MLRIYLLATVGGCFMYQLGERTVRIRKVVGSNPFRSTKKIRDTLSRVSYFFGSLISFVHPKGN